MIMNGMNPSANCLIRLSHVNISCLRHSLPIAAAATLTAQVVFSNLFAFAVGILRSFGFYHTPIKW